MDVLVVINEGPKEGERAYNALRLAVALGKAKNKVAVYLMGDGANAAIPHALASHTRHNLEPLFLELIGMGNKVSACGSCLDTRTITELVAGCQRGTLAELVELTHGADKVLIF